MQAARRVHDDHVAQVVDRVLDALLGDLDRIDAVAAVHAHADLAAERLQLVGRRGAVDVARDEQGAVVLLLQAVRELGRRRRLARALKAHEHDDVGDAVVGQRELGLVAAEQRGELVHDDLDDVLRGRERIHHLGGEAALLGARDELLDDLEVDVGLQKREADLAHRGVDVLLGQAPLAAQAGEDALQAVGKVL